MTILGNDLWAETCQTAPILSPAAIDEIGGRPTRGVFAGHERIVGSVANLIVAERARSHGVIISFRSYFVVGAPLTILLIVFGAFWLSLN